MPVFEILPLEAIGPARLGASRAAAREAMSVNGFPLERSYGRVDYFCEASIQLEYGSGDEVQFIGVSGNLNRPGFSRHSQGSLRNAFQTLPVTADC